MFQHHRLAIETVTKKLSSRDDVLGVIVGGSVAHGYANENSDIDLMIVLSDGDYKNMLLSGNVHYYESESTPWKDGYVDGKYTTVEYIKKVAEFGTEPARFAFDGAFVTYSKLDGLEQLVQQASRYPTERKHENYVKFYAQFEAWKWYYYEGLKRSDKYLMEVSVSNYVLFAGRLVLAYNEKLYPYHKWFLRVLNNVISKPDNMVPFILNVLETKAPEAVEALYKCIVDFHDWAGSDKSWCDRFVLDSELNWLNGPAPIGDI
ncbi:MAG TPA: nucleotidyltransferase domain-containing protein [Mobilitalea sp.]|nr:nucleotidyltransferase domain-containing protein [Mobilitalea sp.]